MKPLTTFDETIHSPRPVPPVPDLQYETRRKTVHLQTSPADDVPAPGDDDVMRLVPPRTAAGGIEDLLG